MARVKDPRPWNTGEQLAQADRVIARETRQRAGILCAWCLGFVPVPGAESHGMCPACTARFDLQTAHTTPPVDRDN
jgi:hypothetical protein